MHKNIKKIELKSCDNEINLDHANFAWGDLNVYLYSNGQKIKVHFCASEGYRVYPETDMSTYYDEFLPNECGLFEVEDSDHLKWYASVNLTNSRKELRCFVIQCMNDTIDVLCRNEPRISLVD